MLGDEALRAIECEVVETVRKNVSMDWTVKETVRQAADDPEAHLEDARCPPDKKQAAT